MTALEELKLTDNEKPIRLPDWIGDMKSLKKLDVSGCRLTELPERYVCMYTCIITGSIITIQ